MYGNKIGGAEMTAPKRCDPVKKGDKKNQRQKRKHQLRGISKKRKLKIVAARPISDNFQPSCSTSDQSEDQLPTENQPHPSLTPAPEKEIGEENLNFSTFCGDTAPFLLIDSSPLCDFLNSHLTCKVCGSSLQMYAPFDDAKGFCLEMKGYCGVCRKRCKLVFYLKKMQNRGIISRIFKTNPI